MTTKIQDIAHMSKVSSSSMLESESAPLITRKDTIIIAMLVNIALLVVLFATAHRKSDDIILPEKVIDQKTHIAEIPQSLPVVEVSNKKVYVDEIDEILAHFQVAKETKQELKQDTKSNVKSAEKKSVETKPIETKPAKDLQEVIIESGDTLGKIANRYNTKVESLVALNNLESTKLKVGQHLMVAAGDKSLKAPEYYVVKSGDNPWTIARKFHIDFADLLRLNDLDEEKAKNLKIGQKLRIK